MELYDGLRKVAEIVQKIDNIEIYRQLLDLSAQALEMQNEINELTKENNKLKEMKNIEAKIERHKDAYITLKEDENKIIYCSRCWDSDRKLIQGQEDKSGMYYCPNCQYHGYYDRDKNDKINDIELNTISF